jgi:hypothetical protein
MKNRLVAVTAVVAVALALWLRPFAAAKAPDVAPLYSGQVVAKVGDTPIYLSQVQARFDSLRSMHGTDPATRKQFGDELLNSFVGDVIVKEGSKDLGVSITPPELALYLAGVVGSFQDDAGLDRFLAQSGATLPQMTYRVYNNFLGARLYEKVASKETLSEDEIRAYFQQNKSSFNVEGMDPVAAYNAAKPSIVETLVKQKKDQAWAAWLSQQQSKYRLDVVMEDWWNQIKAAPKSEQTQNEAPTASPSPSAP